MTATTTSLETVPPELLAQYLLSRGWREAGDFLGNASIWHHGSDREVLLPRSPQLRDYKARMRDVLDVLALTEQRDREAILNDLLRKPADLIKVRLDSPEIIGGTIPIEEAIRLLEATAKMMKFAAAAVVQRRSVFKGGLFAEVREYMHELRVGETEQGSYIINVLSPIEQNRQGFGRKVGLSLASALTAIATFAQDVLTGSNIEVFERSVEAGVSANLCDALLEIGNQPDLQELDFHWYWSPLCEVPLRAAESLSLTKQVFPVLREASKLLKLLG